MARYEVNEALSPHAETLEAFTAAVRALIGSEIMTGRESSDAAIKQANDVLDELALEERLHEAIPLVRACLDLLDRHPAGLAVTQKAAPRFMAAAKDDPALLDAVLTRFVGDEIVEHNAGLSVAFACARRGRLDLFERYLTQACELGLSWWIFDNNDNLKAQVATLVDSIPGLQASLEIVKRFHDAHEAFLAAEPDPLDFAQVMKAARVELKRNFEDARPQRIIAVANPAFRADHAAEVTAFLRDGFGGLKAAARTSGEMINFTLFDAFARAIARWNEPALAGQLVEELAYVGVNDDELVTDDVARIYELNCTGGTIALALAALDYRGSTTALDAFVGEFASSYEGDAWLMKVQYAKWLITGDGAGALAFLDDPVHKKGLAYAACAVADLHHAAALPTLQRLSPTLKDGVAVEVFKEAIARLSSQTTSPTAADRMMNLFGGVTPSEQALGEGSDNVFVERARATAKNPALGEVREADDSSPRER